MLVFAFAFGLSMDYEVFLLARIKELHDARPAQRRGGGGRACSAPAGSSPRPRCSSSSCSSGFVAGELSSIKEIGLALAVAVAVDATLVRCLLVPATMTLLGEWNWWAPACCAGSTAGSASRSTPPLRRPSPAARRSPSGSATQAVQ